MEGIKSGGVMMKKKSGEVIDGSEIMKLVENEEVFSHFVEHKFQEMDGDHDGALSLNELKPAVADIGAALGLSAQGASPDSDNIYSEVLNEFAHGKQGKVSKTDFQEVLSDILLGMADGLKRDPIVILRIDGEDLLEFIRSPSFELKIASVFSELESPNASLRDYHINTFEKLTVEQGMPPASDPWVMSNIVELTLQSCDVDGRQLVSSEAFVEEFKKVAERVAQQLKEQPVIVAHSENSFDGSGIKRLLSNRFELDKALDIALKVVPRDRHGKMSKDYLRKALDAVAPSAGLPPLGAIDEIDEVTANVLKMLDVDDGKMVKEEELKKSLEKILGGIMLQLTDKSITFSTDSVVHEPVASASTILQPSKLS